jgi:hypothetical protein
MREINLYPLARIRYVHPMAIQLSKIDYTRLNARQKENFNFLKVSAVLADYGFMTMRLSDDWQGADFIAQHIDGGTFLKIQLKSRLAFGEKYKGKDLYVAFFHDGDWYLYPHDEVLERVLVETGVGATVSWKERGGYSFPGLSQQMRKLLEPYRICAGTGGVEQTSRVAHQDKEDGRSLTDDYDPAAKFTDTGESVSFVPSRREGGPRKILFDEDPEISATVRDGKWTANDPDLQAALQARADANGGTDQELEDWALNEFGGYLERNRAMTDATEAAMPKPATKADWKTLEQPTVREPLKYHHTFSARDADTLRRGLIPREMEDKWFVYYRDGWVYLHRSWTGALIYWLKLDESPAGARVVESFVSRDPAQYEETDISYDRSLLDFLLRGLILGQDVPFPTRR